MRFVYILLISLVLSHLMSVDLAAEADLQAPIEDVF